MIHRFTLSLHIFLSLVSAAWAQDDWPYVSIVNDCYVELTEDVFETTACIGLAAGTCMTDEEDGFTDVVRLSCLVNEAKVWDVLLNKQYQQTIGFARRADAADLQTSPEYAVREDQIRAAQRAWITFRDASCTMARGGWVSESTGQLHGAECQLLKTAERTIDLSLYLNRFQ